MVCKNVSEKPISKPKHRKGLWSPEEDHKLREYILKHGHGCWSSVPINAGLQRNGKSCRLRWINYLRPGLKKGNFSVEEEETILTMHTMLGNKWSQIATHLPGRTDNEIKNYWHSYLKKSTVAKPNQQETESHPTPSLSVENTPSSSSSSSPSSSSSMNETSAQISDNQQAAKQMGVQLPKVFFAEWLSLDRVQQETLMDKAKTETVPCSSSMEVVDSFSGGLINDDELFGFGFELPEYQNSGTDHDHLVDGSVFGDQFCSGFQMIDDIMYI